jgi:hypothetical protein
MSLIFATQLTAIATAVLAVFAIVTAVFAILAFRKQSQEVRDQAEQLKVQSGVLKIQSEHLDLQREAYTTQARTLELQADEIRESLKQRERDAAARRRTQASRVFIAQKLSRTVPRGYAEREGVEPFVTATVTNTSDQPVYDAELRWHLGPGAHGDPDPIGTIMPGDKASRMRPFPVAANMSNSGAYVRFTDANGVRWLRRPDGHLDEFRHA